MTTLEKFYQWKYRQYDKLKFYGRKALHWIVGNWYKDNSASLLELKLKAEFDIYSFFFNIITP